MRTARILVGDALEVLRTLPAASVRCCVTSPPYWGLRDYGHEGQIGLERTYPEYVARIVAVFAEVRRVLADDGTLWLNLGDCYATGAVGEHPGGGEQGERWKNATRTDSHAGKHTAIAALGPMTQPNRLPQPGLKPKDLVGIPWRVALALQADGWWLRAENIWHKPNPMPSSVRDRPTVAHEQVFLLSKSERYFYDVDAIAEPAVGDHPRNVDDSYRAPGMPAHKGLRKRALRDGRNAFRGQRTLGRGSGKNEETGDRRRAGFNDRWDAAEESGEAPQTRNKRSVWTIATQPFSGAHFAVMPEALVEPCILAGGAEGDTVLDPFCGSGTVGVVALRRGRSFLGIELNPTYAAMARERILGDAPLLNKVASCGG